MRSHILWIFLAQFLIFGILIWAYSPPTEEQLNELAKRAESTADSCRRSMTFLRSSRLPFEFLERLKVLPANDPLKVSFLEAQQEEQKHLKKLLECSPDNMEYTFRLAMSHIREGKRKKGNDLLKTIAKEHEQGLPAAQLYWAKILLTKPASAGFEAARNEDRALNHLKQCAAGDPANVEAQELIASLLLKKGDLKKSFEIFNKLYANDPKHYSAICTINEQLDIAHKNINVLNSASIRLKKSIADNVDDICIWVQSWQGYIDCLTRLEKFELAENELQLGIERITTELAQQKFLEKLFADLYLNWANSIGGENRNMQLNQLELIQRALVYNAQHPEGLTLATRLGFSSDESVRAKALRIYDPNEDLGAPGNVLFEIGKHFYQAKDFATAVEYLEKARERSPRHAEAIFMLSKAYLKIEQAKPERALLLLDQVMSRFPACFEQPSPSGIANSMTAKEKKRYLAEMYKVRGLALEKIDRPVDAFASLELAAETLTDDDEITAALTRVYSATLRESDVNK